MTRKQGHGVEVETDSILAALAPTHSLPGSPWGSAVWTAPASKLAGVAVSHDIDGVVLRIRVAYKRRKKFALPRIRESVDERLIPMS